MGLLCSAPLLHNSFTHVSPISSILITPGGPGTPGNTPARIHKDRESAHDPPFVGEDHSTLTSVQILTYNLKVSVRCIAVHHSLSCAGVTTLVPNLDVLYPQVTAAVVALRGQTEGHEENRKGVM